MDLRRLFQVLARFRHLVIAGVVAAFAVSLLSLIRIDFDGLQPRVEYRSAETWQSVGTLFVTQQGFPWGRSALSEVVPVGPEGSDALAPKYPDPGRFTSLAILYSQLAKGDEVRALMLRDGPIPGEYDAAPVRAEDGTTLPLITIGGRAATPEDAEAIASRITAAFLLYLEQIQERNRIPVESRVQVEVIEEPAEAVRIEGRRMTRPAFLFVLLLSATMMLAFALENLRPRSSPLASAAGTAPTPLPETSRKTA